MGSDLIEVEVYAPGMSVDGTRVSVPDFAQALTLIAIVEPDHELTEAEARVTMVPQLLVRFGPTRRYHDGYEVWEETSREVVV